ncbi:radical SAM-linked protein [Dethiosulfatibacter aminovorans DSM 17477]|uniref:Radical SAM-linked protein n=1 Tax=Dethiosulfatibacter aminovorans DSM 17477 TaxID=1121476 RepID=A0A1M6CXL2_9FIRM|nr:TIGR03936 family radical SAM-associated protein [Dethiosulfatibacter aminovorans]SHI65613.1 radical SAM-linked protein [Dethiosulfatibacter aminovorans DSM 17477]
MKIVFKFTKLGRLKFISHLDTMRVLQRSLRRTMIPVKYSEGYNPHPKLSIAFPLSLGIESTGEYGEVEIDGNITSEDFMDKMNRNLPEGMKIIEADEYNNKKAVSALISSQVYNFTVSFEEEDALENAIKSLNSILDDEYIIERVRKKKNKIKRKTINVVEYIHGVKMRNIEGLEMSFDMTIDINENGSLKVEEMKEFITSSLKKAGRIKVKRINLNFIDKVM